MRPYHWITLTILIAIAIWFIYRTGGVNPRVESTIDLNWKFTLNDPLHASKVNFDDSDWRYVTLPHDWMIEQTPDRENPSGTAGGFYPSGIGWYRKSLDISEFKDKDQFYLLFEGIYMNADVYFNGQHLGKQINGYTSFYHDVSKLVRKDTINIIAIRTDCSQLPVDRWYSGAGIYRHVRLIATDKLHIPIWGCHAQSSLNGQDSAEIKVSLELINNSRKPERIDIRYDIIDSNGKIAAEGKSIEYLKAGENSIVQKTFNISEPELWSPDNPRLYKIVCTLSDNSKTFDQIELTHGIRSIQFDPDMGFLLNGKKVIMKGVCLHHDGGELGSAISEAGWERRLKILKTIGVNAIRFAHNPHAPGVLDLCDKMGFLVIDEMYDKWEIAWNDAAPVIQFSENWESDLTNFIKRDRNHPSVVLWSVGNEVIEQFTDPEKGAGWYRSMIDITRSLDPTREVTCAMHPGSKEGEDDIPSSMIQVSNIVAYNYRSDEFDKWHKTYPDKIFIGTETKPYGTNRPEDYKVISFIDNSWFDMSEHIAGQFVWTGIDYLGESMGWPDRGFKHGILYSNGFAKPITHFYRSIYSDIPMVKLTVLDTFLADSLNNLEHWQASWASPPLVDHWTFENDSSIKNIVLFTNCESVEISLNNKIIDTLYRSNYKDGVIQRMISYEPGTLSAKAFYTDANGNAQVTSDMLKTAGSPYAITLDPDKLTLIADGTDLVHITTKIVDSVGTLTPQSNHLVNYEVKGPGTLKIIDNGDFSDNTPYGANSKEVRNGKHLVIIQISNEPGDLIISANAQGLNPAKVKITSK